MRSQSTPFIQQEINYLLRQARRLEEKWDEIFLEVSCAIQRVYRRKCVLEIKPIVDRQPSSVSILCFCVSAVQSLLQNMYHQLARL